MKKVIQVQTEEAGFDQIPSAYGWTYLLSLQLHPKFFSSLILYINIMKEIIWFYSFTIVEYMVFVILSLCLSMTLC